MKRILSTFLFPACLLFAQNSYAQFEPQWSIGAGIGGVTGVNEATHQSLNPQFHLNALWYNGIAPHWSIEGSIGWGKISSLHQGGFSEYSTNIMPIDLRLRFGPFENEQWQPYIYAGVGLLRYSVTSSPPNASPEAKLNSTSAFLPLGIGLYHPIDKQWAFDASIGENPSFTDDLNPVRDNRNDAYWGFSIGVSFFFGEGKPREEKIDEFDFGARGNVSILTNTFDSASSMIKSGSDTLLREALETLNDHPEIEIEIRSYTDNSGDFNTSMILTQDRAESIKVWFVSRGISASRISTQGYGPHNPRVPNTSPENMEKNRRIEIVRMK
jgi:outer membrane protein OmpA-like peptidoglycan-associated protein